MIMLQFLLVSFQECKIINKLYVNNLEVMHSDIGSVTKDQDRTKTFIGVLVPVFVSAHHNSTNILSVGYMSFSLFRYGVLISLD